MRSLSDVDRQINQNFQIRLAEVLADEPQHKVRAAVAASASERGLATDQIATSELALHDVLHELNAPEWFPGIALRFGLARQILDLGLIGYTALSCGDIGAARAHRADACDDYALHRRNDPAGREAQELALALMY